MNKYHRTIFFTKVPLQGHYRYRDVFQIFPCDMENMPTYSGQKHYPNILEFVINEEDILERESPFGNLKDLYTHTATVYTKQARIYALLSTFTNNLFFSYTGTFNDGVWGFPILDTNTDEEINNASSKWCNIWYHFPDLPRQLKIEKFSEPKLDTIKRIPHIKFYTDEPNIDFDTKTDIIFPSTIDILFDSYFALDSITSSLIDSATSYTVSAMELYNSRKTLALLASFTAMETMVNLEYKDVPIEKCKECGQLRFSVAKKFREFLLKYVGNTPENKKKYNLYYSTRSKIVHTGSQLKTELLFADVTEKEKDDEWATRVEILQIGKLSIINWLLRKKMDNLILGLTQK